MLRMGPKEFSKRSRVCMALISNDANLGNLKWLQRDEGKVRMFVKRKKKGEHPEIMLFG